MCKKLCIGGERERERESGSERERERDIYIYMYGEKEGETEQNYLVSAYSNPSLLVYMLWTCGFIAVLARKRLRAERHSCTHAMSAPLVFAGAGLLSATTVERDSPSLQKPV